jgi:hypothetical protein
MEAYNRTYGADLKSNLSQNQVTSQKTDNYWGISLTSILAKTYNKMILNGACFVLDPLLMNKENGFWRNRTTVGQIIAL